MNEKGPDQDLGELFSWVRREEELEAPDFAWVWREAEKRHAGTGHSGMGRWVLVAAAIIAAAGIVLVMNDLNRPPSGWKACAITEWTAPTDFLLYTPGSELLDTWPKIGSKHTSFALELSTTPAKP